MLDRDILMLAATLYPNARMQGYAVEQAIDHSLDVAEKMVARALARAKQKEDEAKARLAIALVGRPLEPTG